MSYTDGLWAYYANKLDKKVRAGQDLLDAFQDVFKEGAETAMWAQRIAIANRFEDAVDPTSDEIYSMILDTRVKSQEEVKQLCTTPSASKHT